MVTKPKFKRRKKAIVECNENIFGIKKKHIKKSQRLNLTIILNHNTLM